MKLYFVEAAEKMWATHICIRFHERVRAVFNIFSTYRVLSFFCVWRWGKRGRHLNSLWLWRSIKIGCDSTWKCRQQYYFCTYTNTMPINTDAGKFCRKKVIWGGKAQMRSHYCVVSYCFFFQLFTFSSIHFNHFHSIYVVSVR